MLPVVGIASTEGSLSRRESGIGPSARGGEGVDVAMAAVRSEAGGGLVSAVTPAEQPVAPSRTPHAATTLCLTGKAPLRCDVLNVRVCRVSVVQGDMVRVNARHGTGGHPAQVAADSVAISTPSSSTTSIIRRSHHGSVFGTLAP